MSRKIGEEYGEYEEYGENGYEEEELEEFSVEEIIAEFKGTEPKTPEGRLPDAPVFGARPRPASEPEPWESEKKPAEPALFRAQTKQKPVQPPAPPPKPAEPPLRRPEPPPPAPPAEERRQESSEPEEGRVIDMASLSRRRPKPEKEEEEPEARRPQAREKEPPQPEPPPLEEEEDSRVRRFPLNRRPSILEEPEPEEEEEPPESPPPFDFLFEADEKDIPHTIANLSKKLRRLRRRSILCLLLAALGCLITALPQLPVALPEGYGFAQVPHYYFWALNLLLCCSMLAADDVLLAGAYRLAIFRPTLDTVAAAGAFSSLAQGVWHALQKGDAMPYTAVAQVTLFYCLLAKRGRLLTLRRVYKAAGLSANPACVCTKEDGKQRTMAYKTQLPQPPDLGCVDSPDAVMRFSQFYGPLAIVAAAVLAFMASFGARRPDRFADSLAAITAMAAPAGMLLSAATPGVRISKKLFTAGTALLNDQSAREMAWAELAVLTDPDIFPNGSVAISGMKVARNMSMEKAVASAAAALKTVGGGLSHVFSDFAKQQYIFVPEPNRVQYYENGGISVQIGRDNVLCGSANFLTRMGVHVTEGRTIKSGVFVAVNSSFAAVFALKYNAQPQAQSAFRVLRLGRLRPVLAMKDFNATPFMVEDKFDLRPGQAEFPSMEERVALGMGGQGQDVKPLALLSRDSMLSFCECVTAARRLCRAVRLNLVCSTAAAVFGMGLMYFLASADQLQAAGPLNVIFYLLLWYAPVWLFSQVASKI